MFLALVRLLKISRSLFVHSISAGPISSSADFCLLVLQLAKMVQNWQRFSRSTLDSSRGVSRLFPRSTRSMINSLVVLLLRAPPVKKWLYRSTFRTAPRFVSYNKKLYLGPCSKFINFFIPFSQGQLSVSNRNA